MVGHRCASWCAILYLLSVAVLISACASPNDRDDMSPTSRSPSTSEALALHETAVRECSKLIRAVVLDSGNLSFENWTDDGFNPVDSEAGVKGYWVYTVEVAKPGEAATVSYSCRLTEETNGRQTAELIPS